jgi:hypothetical protein
MDATGNFYAGRELSKPKWLPRSIQALDTQRMEFRDVLGFGFAGITDIVHGDIRAFLGKNFGDATADPAAGSGDDGNLTFQFHDVLCWLWVMAAASKYTNPIHIRIKKFAARIFEPLCRRLQSARLWRIQHLRPAG